MSLYSGQKVLVTGAMGLIGREVVKLLVKAGAIVRASCRQEVIDPVPDVDYIQGDLESPEVCARLARGMRYVFHLASVKGSVGLGQSRAADFFVKPLLMNTNMMEQSRKAGVERYLFASSVCVYAPAPTFIEDRAWDEPPHPSDAFAGWAKRMGEMQAAAYKEQYGWDKVAIIRPVNTYGPYDDFDPRTALVIPALIARVLGGENPLRVWGSGDAVRDFVHCRDAARGALLALEKSANGQPINIGSGIGYSIRQIVDAVLEATGADADVLWDAGKATGETYRVADIARAREVLGFTPEVGLQQGIAETVRWYREHMERPELRRARFASRKKTKVGLVQINNSFSGQSYLPLAVGMLQAYAQRHLRRPAEYEFLLPIYSRRPVAEIVDSLANADIVFVSVYVWNMRISLEVARALKARRPDVLIVFGGPQVPDRDENFLRMYPFVDVACHGEGEQTALALLEQLQSRNWSGVPSISYVDDEGRLVRNPRGERARDLAEFPSPYLEDVFAPLMAAHPEEHWIALWETNRGCPFSCTFCDWGSATASKVYTFDIERLQREVEWFADHRIEYVFCCDANFGLLPRDVELASFVAATKRARGYPHALSVQATKNATERAYQTQKILADAGLNKGVDIALQSIDVQTLKAIKRANISTDTYQELQRRFTRDRIETYTDLILGLPGETYDSFATAVSTLIQNGQHNRIQFNNLSILPNAEMGDPEYQRRHGLVTIETNTINIHGSVSEAADDISETQQLVIASDAMPKEAWVETRTYAWLAAFLYFDKILQIPLLLVHEQCGIGYRELFERFAAAPADRYPTLASIHRFLRDKARDIQQGGPEYCLSDRWLPIWWPADEYLLIQLCVEGRLPAFYREAERLLEEIAAASPRPIEPQLLHDAVRLNERLLKQPFQSEDADVELSHNIWEYYQAIVVGEVATLERGKVRYRIDRTSKTWSAWDDWCREVVWWGNKKGAYLYSNNAVEAQLSGHF